MKEENSKNNRKIRKRVKRQVSIFTVMLWIFLIATMITITVNSTKKTNALEVEDENWNIQLVMYDRSSDTPTDAITEFTWNAVNTNETKQLCMQINYACTTNKGYQPGEIEITIPGIAKKSFSEYWRGATGNYSYATWLQNSITIAADKISDTTKKYDWSYNYDSVNNVYTFKNNMAIAENEHFEGTIQIVYNLFPRFKIKTDLEYVAKIKENLDNVEEIISMESNSCNFHYTSTKKAYALEKKAIVAPKADYTKIEDILDNYYWVEYYFNIGKDNKILEAYGYGNRVISEDISSNSIKEILPEGCVVYDHSLNKIEPVQDNEYHLYSCRGSAIIDYYIGYPKNRYSEGEKIENTAELWGRYEDETERQKLAEKTVSLYLKAFDFTYKGNLYDIEKSGSYTVYKNKIESINNGDDCWFNLHSTAFYTDSVMDVEIGDDLLYITRENGDITKLNDDEYNFTNIEIPKFSTYNKYTGNEGEALIGYNYEIQVRYKNTSEYVLYKEGVTNNNHLTEIKFDRDDIVGVKVVIKDLDKTLYDNGIGIRGDQNIYTKDSKADGKIYNFAYLQVYKKDNEGNRTLVNEPTLDSYKTPISKEEIAEYDINAYGTYMQRSYSTTNIIDGEFRLYTEKTRTDLINNVKEEKYETEYKLDTKFDIENIKVDKDVIIKQYDILPIGMNLASDEKEIINSITSDLPYENLKLKDGTIFNTQKELEDYIKENTTVDIDYNYKESGRIKISIIYNLNEVDWSYYLLNSFSVKGIYTDIKAEIPYDSILEYGTSYINYTYAMWNNQEYGYNKRSSNTTTDNGE